MSRDPDLARLQRATRRRDRRRRRGNVVVAVVLGSLVVANVVLISGAVSGVSTVERIARVDIAGFTPLGRAVAGDPQAAAPAGDTGSAARADGGERGLTDVLRDLDIPATGSSLPTWAGSAADAVAGTALPTMPSSDPAADPSDPLSGATAPPGPQVAATTTGPPPPQSTPAPTPAAPATLPAGPGSRVLELVNAERATAGCPALAPDAALASAAAAHATDMVARQFFDHTSPDGSTAATRAAAAGYPGSVAENIATGYAAADAVVVGWMDSPVHRANILDCAQRVTGIGHDPGSLPGYAPGTWVQLFGTS